MSETFNQTTDESINPATNHSTNANINTTINHSTNAATKIAIKIAGNDSATNVNQNAHDMTSKDQESPPKSVFQIMMVTTMKTMMSLLQTEKKQSRKNHSLDSTASNRKK